MTETPNGVETEKDKTPSKPDNTITATSTPIETVVQDDRNTVKNVSLNYYGFF